MILINFQSAPTHGDFNSLQILFDREDNVVALVDFARAANLPYVWDIIRSFSSSDLGCIDGRFDTERLSQYVSTYHEIMPLNQYDVGNMVKLFLYQIARSNYGYWQGLHRCKDYESMVNHGHWRTNVIRYLFKNIDEITESLSRIVKT